MKVTLHHTENVGPHIRTFYFEPERPVQYTAGQFVEITLPLEHPDERGKRREFTLSSSPTEEFLSITTRYSIEKPSSFKKALFKLKDGAELTMTEPMGDFVLPKLIQTPLVFVAGGMGITPFRSMFKWLSDTLEERNIQFIYGVRTEDDIIVQPEMDDAKIHATILVSDPTPAWGGVRGRITAERIMGLKDIDENTLVYLSGPESMVEDLSGDLRSLGLSYHHIVTDAFHGYSEV